MKIHALPRPTRLLHMIFTDHLNHGDVTIDATAGNGHDTLFLAETTGPSGHVHAFDIQPAAIVATRQRLAGAGLLDRATLHPDSHTKIATLSIPPPAAIVFNLGYLPGGDHSILTSSRTTLEAISASVAILRPGGLLAVICYPGHPGGSEETLSVISLLASFTHLRTARYELLETNRPSPILLLSSEPG